MNTYQFIEYNVDGGVLGPNDHRSRGVYWSVLGPEMPTPVRRQDRERYRTNNDAEWLAVREALLHAKQHYPGRPIIIYSDSRLVVNQYNGKWQLKLMRHTDLHDQCKQLAGSFPFVALKWVPRAVSVEKLGH